MTKHARKAGNIIFVLVISFLLIMGCVFASDTIKGKTDNTNLDNMANTLQTTADVTYTLPGNFSDNERIWNEAVQYSQNNGTTNVLVKLNGNWTAATNSTYGTSFGSGSGFSNGRIYVPSGANIILDLNGKTIDRGLSSQRSNGSVIFVEGILRLIDSGFDSKTIYDLTGLYDESTIHDITSGKIKGGNNSFGGGIEVIKGEFYMYGGAIYKNKATGGGGIFGSGSATIHIYDGIIYNNMANSQGGGVYVMNHCKAYIHGGHIFGNRANNEGGGIASEVGDLEISGGKISYNTAKYNGGAIYLTDLDNDSQATTKIDNCIITNNIVTGSGGAIYSDSSISLDGTEIRNNQSQKGSAIFIDHLSKITLKNSIIVDNVTDIAESYAIELSEYRLTVKRLCYLIGNNVIITSNKNSQNKERNINVDIDYFEMNLIEYAPNTRIGISLGSGNQDFIRQQSAENNEIMYYLFYNDKDGSTKGSAIQFSQYNSTYRFVGTQPTVDVAQWSYKNTKHTDPNEVTNVSGNYVEVPYMGSGGTYTVSCKDANGSSIGKMKFPGSTNSLSSIKLRNAGTYILTVGGETDGDNYTGKNTLIFKIVPKVTYRSENIFQNKQYGDGEINADRIYLYYSYVGESCYANLTNEIGGLNVGLNVDFISGPITNYDGTADNNYKLALWDRVVIFTVVPKYLTKPTVITNSYEYDGNSHQIELKNFDSTYMSALRSYTDVGEYTQTISIKSPGNCYWRTDSGSASGTDTSMLTFDWKITPKPIEKPTAADSNEFVFNNAEHTYLPSGYDSSQMVITGNKNTDVGEYTAKVTPNANHKWSDNTTTAIEFKYRIFPPGVIVKDGIKYDYLYIDSNNIKKSYGNSYIHRVDDQNLNLVNGISRHILGNIPINTSIETFLQNLYSDRNLIKIYAKESDITPIYDGLSGTRSNLSQTLATGFKVELYDSSEDATLLDTIYLSVLGDINGDGMINASDVSYLRQVASDSTLLESMPLEKRLAGMINNKGGITEVDSEILRNYIGKEIDLDKFMESETESTNTGYIYLTLDRDNMLRKVSETKTNVIGNISVNTSVEMLKTKLAEMGINISAMTIYNRKGYEVSDNTAIVGTGWRIEVGGEVTYLSVLGDLTGDGRITAADISYLRAIAASDTTTVQDCVLLSAILLNKGGITTADSEVLKQSINKKTDINKY